MIFGPIPTDADQGWNKWSLVILGSALLIAFWIKREKIRPEQRKAAACIAILMLSFIIIGIYNIVAMH